MNLDARAKSDRRVTHPLARLVLFYLAWLRMTRGTAGYYHCDNYSNLNGIGFAVAVELLVARGRILWLNVTVGARRVTNERQRRGGGEGGGVHEPRADAACQSFSPSRVPPPNPALAVLLTAS
jgi:hypothetical protein